MRPRRPSLPRVLRAPARPRSGRSVAPRTLLALAVATGMSGTLAALVSTTSAAADVTGTTVSTPTTSTTSTTIPDTTTTSAASTSTATPSAATPSAATPSAATPNGNTTVSAYWLVASDGGIFAFGGAGFFGSTGAMVLNKPVVAMAGTSDSQGYWLVASDGGIFAFGDAPFYGSTGNINLAKPVVGMAANPKGGGYWLVASDGGIFSFGSAQFYGSMGNRPLNQPIVGMAATPDGGGYWLVAADGGIFAFGDAQFYGSTGNLHLNQPIVGMTPTPDGQGYWFTAKDGGVFAYGDAGFYGSLGSVPQSRPIVAITSTTDGKGYWFTNSNGAVSAYGDAPYWGSAPQVLNKPIVGLAEAAGNGNFTGSSYASGSFGYDISKFQCTSLPPSPHTIGVVEVNGIGLGAVNPCLATQAAWAGAGLNLYTYLSCSDSGGTNGTTCTYATGYAEGQYAYQQAVAAGINTSVGWWLDVEDPNWSQTSTGANAALVQGAIDAIHGEGINSVGIYASPGVWNTIVGSYQPAVPYWAASWKVNPATTCTSVRQLFPTSKLPTGPVQLVQYSSPSAVYSLGGMNTAYDDDYAC